MIRSAAELFRAQGMEATGFSEILAASGAARGAIYHHFPGGKEELAAAVVAANGRDVVAALEQVLARDDDPAVAVRRFITDYAEAFERSGFAFGCPIAPTVLEAANRSEAIRGASAAAFASWEQAIATRLVDEGAEPARAGAIATLVIASIEGALVLSRAARDVAPFHRVADALADAVRSAVGS